MSSKFAEVLSFFQKGQLNEAKKLCLEILMSVSSFFVSVSVFFILVDVVSFVEV